MLTIKRWLLDSFAQCRFCWQGAQQAFCQSLLLVCALLGPALPLAAADLLLDRIVAIVNDEIILLSELEQRAQQQRGQFIDDEQLLQAMILENIQLQLARRFNISVGNSEVNSILEEQALRAGLALGVYLRALENEGADLPELRTTIQRQLLLQKTRGQLLGRSISVRDDEIEAFFATRAAAEAFGVEYQIGYIGADGEHEDLVQSIYEDLQEQNFSSVSSRWQSDERLRVRSLDWQPAAQLPTLFAELAPGLQVGGTHAPVRNNRGWNIVTLLDQRLAYSSVTEYQITSISLASNPVRDQQATEQLARELYQQLQADTSAITSIARSYSDDALSSGNGGDLGWRASKPSSFPSGLWARLTQAQVGDLLLNNDDGDWQIVLLRDIRSSDNSLERARASARQVIFENKMRQALPKWLEEVRDQAYVEVKIEALSEDVVSPAEL